MSNGNTPDGDKKQKIFTSLVQNNMRITGANNPEILQGIKNGNNNYYSWAFYDFHVRDASHKHWRRQFYHRLNTYERCVSKDGNNWNEIFTEYHAKCNDTIIIMDSIRYIRLKGKNNKNEEFHIINFKII